MHTRKSCRCGTLTVGTLVLVLSHQKFDRIFCFCSQVKTHDQPFLFVDMLVWMIWCFTSYVWLTQLSDTVAFTLVLFMFLYCHISTWNDHLSCFPFCAFLGLVGLRHLLRFSREVGDVNAHFGFYSKKKNCLANLWRFPSWRCTEVLVHYVVVY